MPRLIVFTRVPTTGKVKTRLIPALGPEGAAKLHRDMSLHTLHWVHKLQRFHGVAVEIHFADGDEQRVMAEFGSDWRYRLQPLGDLGRRLETAFADASQPTVVIGTDCPDLGASEVIQAFTLLAAKDVVLGPAKDGGYYLIGLNRPSPALFTGIAWGTSSVCAETQCAAASNGLSVGLLPTLADVDRPEDLPIWHAAQQRAARPGITVVIPTLNEAKNLPATLGSIVRCSGIETIVVDGGSCDDTCAVALRFGARVLASSPGRARQMNVGATAASADLLIFLHADTRLPEGFVQHIHATLSQPGVVCGAFQLRIDTKGLPYRLVEWGANLRSRWLQCPYGDQALFMTAATFREVGGFPNLPIMEDVEMVRHLRRYGRIALIPLDVTTSVRRWKRLGFFKTTLLNQLILAAYFLGCGPKRLATWYRKPSQ